MSNEKIQRDPPFCPSPMLRSDVIEAMAKRPPTPQSDQAATTPDVLKLLSDFTNKHYRMAALEENENVSEVTVRKAYNDSLAAENALIEALRAQSAELLALRALSALASFEHNIAIWRGHGGGKFFVWRTDMDGYCTTEADTLAEAIGNLAALNFPTQKSPAK